MRLLFLGSGSAFTVGDGNFHSNLLLTSESGRRFLIDAGSDLRFSLHAAGLSHRDITDVYISHLHADHVGGLEYLAFTTGFDPACTRPIIYTAAELARPLWENTLSGGMQQIPGSRVDISRFFELRPIADGGTFTWESVSFLVQRVVHVDTGTGLMPSFGLVLTVPAANDPRCNRILITTDTTLHLPTLGPHYEAADLIFHDCETALRPTPVHARYEDLCQLPAALRKKMWLYGYQPGPLPDAVADGFLGFVRRGQEFQI